MRLTVIGTGYLGAVHAACSGKIGYEVLGIDIDAERIAAFATGRPLLFEPGLALRQALVDANLPGPVNLGNPGERNRAGARGVGTAHHALAQSSAGSRGCRWKKGRAAPSPGSRHARSRTSTLRTLLQWGGDMKPIVLWVGHSTSFCPVTPISAKQGVPVAYEAAAARLVRHHASAERRHRS